MAIADQWCRGKLISVLEGGYHLTALATSAAAHIKALMNQPA
jgi:acetoin utilization deacetylase AcuC-like enzyme